jgi:hypothetical protein
LWFKGSRNFGIVKQVMFPLILKETKVEGGKYIYKEKMFLHPKRR